jgi:hypothetical protein
MCQSPRPALCGVMDCTIIPTQRRSRCAEPTLGNRPWPCRSLWSGRPCAPSAVMRIRNGVRPVANSWCAPALSPGAGRRRRRCLENVPHDVDIAEAVGEGDGVSGPRLAVSGAGRQDHGGASRARSPRLPAPQTRAHAGTTGWIPWGWLSINSIARGGHLGQAASVRGQSNQVLSGVLRAGRASTAGLSPLSTPDSILICSRNLSRRLYLWTRGSVVPEKTEKAL